MVQIVDSASVTAKAVAGLLNARGDANPQTCEGSDSFFVTDFPERFERIAERFLGRKIAGKVKQTGVSMVHADNAADELAKGA